MQLVTLHDLDRQGSAQCERRRHLRFLIVGIGEDVFDEGEPAPCATVEYQPSAITILQVSRVDDDVQQEAKRVDENVPLATRDLLACVIPRWIERRAPFCAPLALWA